VQKRLSRQRAAPARLAFALAFRMATPVVVDPATSITQIAGPASAAAGRRSPRSHAQKQGELLLTWEHLSSRPSSDALATVEAEHRQHAVVELAIGDLNAKRSRTARRASLPPKP
jgi:hypothetical protein